VGFGVVKLGLFPRHLGMAVRTGLAQ
jgi:hypothetical protein